MTAMPLSDQIWYGQKRGSWGSATPHSRARGLIVPKNCWDIPTYVQTVWPYTNQIWYGNAMYTTRLLHDDLHWLDVPERIQYKISVTVHCCLQSKAPKYLADCCTPVSVIASRRHLIRSASRHHLSVPRYRLTTFGRWAFSVAGPTVWNSTGQSPRPGS